MKHFSLFFFIALSVSLSGCTNSPDKKDPLNETDTAKPAETTGKNTNTAAKIMADAATILARKEVPVLCYHQIRDWNGSDSKSARDYIVPTQAFQQHIKMLADSGYHTVLPDQLYDYYAYGTALPEKPIMLTYDDTDDDQFTIAAPEMKKYGFKGVFFIMTVSINRPKYMTTDQLKQLANEGHVIESHTWDHHNVKGYKTEQDWLTQIEKPKKKIEEITGKVPEHFAYPFGLWNREAIPELKKRGVRSAYILSTKRDPDDPLYTIRRIIASGFWSAPTLYRSMIQSFD
jgi:peptidoglycan/xylan/chitin deacetylase (PgdA/CDA1 family)